MKRINRNRINKLTPKDILGFSTGAGVKGFIQATEYIGRHDFTGKLFNFTAVEAINLGNYFATGQTWPKVLEQFNYYATNGGAVYRFNTEKELMAWLGQ